MTISSTTRVAGPFVGAGTTATFPFPFAIFEVQDLLVETLDVATSAIATLALTTDYTVAMNADQDTSPGGSITLTAGNLATGYDLFITTDIAALQGLDLTNGGAFYPDVINAALDLLTVLVQQLAVQTALSLQAPLVDGSPTMTLPPAAERAGMMLGFDSNGNPTLIAMAAGGTVPGAQGATGLVNSINKTFTFVSPAGATPIPLIYVAGIFQDPGTDYGVITSAGGNNWQFTLTNAPIEGPVVVVMLA